MALRRLSLTRGDSRTYTLTFTNGSSGTVYNIKNWVVKFTLKSNPDLTDAQASLQKIVTTFADTTSGTSGVAVVTLNPSDTANLDAQVYDFDIQVTTALGENYTVMKGKFDLEYDISRTAGTAGSA